MNDNSGDVDIYLGRVFDLLAGTGARGRRALVEIEDHLRCAVDDARAAGLSSADAERVAIERFGPPEQTTAALRATLVEPWGRVVARLIGGAWLLGAIGLVTIGVSGVFAAGARTVWGNNAVAFDPPAVTYSPARCAYLLEYYPQPDGNCRAASIAHHAAETVTYRFAAGLLGVLAFGVWWLARKRRLRVLRAFAPITATPPPIVLATIGAVGFGIVALVLVGQGVDAFAIDQPGGWSAIATGVAAIPAFAVFTFMLLNEMRGRPALS